MTTCDLVRLDVLTGASDAFDRVAERLIGLHNAWQASGVDPSSLGWVKDLIFDAGWWSGRLLAEACLDADES
jgi:hypothetical protein